MRKFPLFVDLNERKVLVVGGGNIAERRVRVLCEFGATILLVCKECTDFLHSMAEEKRILLEKRPYCKEDCTGAYMVLAATGDAALNEQIVHDAHHFGALANACHNKSLCDFYFPGIAYKGESIVVGITASGDNHKKAADLRKKMQNWLDEEGIE